MENMVLDIRCATCQGGGALWTLLSHFRDIPLGGSIELLTDDPLASKDIPEWTEREGWTLVEREALPGYNRFVVRRGIEVTVG